MSVIIASACHTKITLLVRNFRYVHASSVKQSPGSLCNVITCPECGRMNFLKDVTVHNTSRERKKLVHARILFPRSHVAVRNGEIEFGAIRVIAVRMQLHRSQDGVAGYRKREFCRKLMWEFLYRRKLVHR